MRVVRSVWVAIAVVASASCRGGSGLDATADGAPSRGSNAVSGERDRSQVAETSSAGAASVHSNDAGQHAVADAGRADRIDNGASACAAASTHEAHEQRALPSVSAPEMLGVLAGPNSAHPPDDLQLYGTDLGFSFEHQGQLFLMFGDTLPTPNDLCNERLNDDTIAMLPKSFDGTVPKLVFRRHADAPNDFVPARLMRGLTSLSLGFGQAPLTAFSDGEHAFAVFDRLELLPCEGSGPDAATCAADEDLSCSTRIGQCQPLFNGVIPPLCNVEALTGCLAGQQCSAASAAVCIDKTSSQYDGSIEGEIAAAAEVVELAARRSDDPEVFDAVLEFPTNKFISMTARTIEHLDSDPRCNDYRPGHHELLIWGRPRYSGQGGREAQLYLMAHSLPLTFEASGRLRFEPRYFAGVDPATDEPAWSSRQSDAKPLAMDGIVDGDPHEALHIVNHTAVSWLGAPIDKWVMLYGGGLSDMLLLDAAGARYQPAPGAIMIRFADHPWGPWSPAQPHLVPGSPTQVGDPYGPGGFLYHPDCRDASPATCTPPDALDQARNGTTCLANLVLWDAGQLYGANIIDPYIAPNAGGGLDMIWNVSTWNPYSVVMMRTAISNR